MTLSVTLSASRRVEGEWYDHFSPSDPVDATDIAKACVSIGAWVFPILAVATSHRWKQC